MGAEAAKAAVRRPLAGPGAREPLVIREDNLVTEGDDLPRAGSRRFAPPCRIFSGTMIGDRSARLAQIIPFGDALAAPAVKRDLQCSDAVSSSPSGRLVVRNRLRRRCGR